MSRKIKHPWQAGATELIKYAIEHQQKENAFSQRIAFLLLDIGVETLFKTYLMLPESITDSKTKFHDRKKAAKGGFHGLLEAVKISATDELAHLSLTHVEYYHEIRNKLYHDGEGITVSEEKVKNYARLAIDLLKALLDVDLEFILEDPKLVEKEEKRIAEAEAKIKYWIKEIEERTTFFIEKLEPQLLMPSKIAELTAIKSTEDFEEFAKGAKINSFLKELRTSTFYPERVSLLVGNVTLFYFSILEKHYPNASKWNTAYSIADLYPLSAMQPSTVAYDENDEAILRWPTLSEVISEGEGLLVDLEQVLREMENTILPPGSAP